MSEGEKISPTSRRPSPPFPNGGEGDKTQLDAAPSGAEYLVGLESINMPRLTVLGTARRHER